MGRSGGIGRRDGFKIHFPYGSGGSSPPSGTILSLHPGFDARELGLTRNVFANLMPKLL